MPTIAPLIATIAVAARICASTAPSDKPTDQNNSRDLAKLTVDLDTDHPAIGDDHLSLLWADHSGSLRRASDRLSATVIQRDASIRSTAVPESRRGSGKSRGA